MTYSDPAALKKELQTRRRAIRQQGEKAAATKRSALAFLVRAGICCDMHSLQTETFMGIKSDRQPSIKVFSTLALPVSSTRRTPSTR